MGEVVWVCVGYCMRGALECVGRVKQAWGRNISQSNPPWYFCACCWLPSRFLIFKFKLHLPSRCSCLCCTISIVWSGCAGAGAACSPPPPAAAPCTPHGTQLPNDLFACFIVFVFFFLVFSIKTGAKKNINKRKSFSSLFFQAFRLCRRGPRKRRRKKKRGEKSTHIPFATRRSSLDDSLWRGVAERSGAV